MSKIKSHPGSRRGGKFLPEYLRPIKEDGPDGKLKALFQRRHRASLIINQCHKDFEGIKNPLAVWDAYLTVRQFKMEIPGWILQYFDDVAKRMMFDDKVPDDLSELLGFKWKKQLRDGGPNPWLQYRSLQVRRTAVAYATNLLNESPHLTIDEACKKTSEWIEERWPESGREYKPENERMKARKKYEREEKGKTLSPLTIRKWYVER